MAMRKNILVLFFFLSLLSAACGGTQNSSEVAPTLTSAALTANAPVILPSQTPIPTDAPTPTFTPDTRIRAEVLDVLNLRSGPSSLHDVLGVAIAGEIVYIKGRDPEGKWYYLDYDDPEAGATLTGWMSAEYLRLLADKNTLPLAPYPDELKVRGVVIDTEGNLIPNVEINVVLRITDDRQERAESITDENGEFIFYIPDYLYNLGVDIEAIGPNCGSPMVDNNCEMQYFEVIDHHRITIPQTESLTFVYEKATTFLAGKVTTRGGWALDNMIVYAQREEDGADSQALTDKGQFVLPLGEGTWRIIAIRTIIYWPDQESDPLYVTIIPGIDPEPVHIIGPWEVPSKDD